MWGREVEDRGLPGKLVLASVAKILHWCTIGEWDGESSSGARSARQGTGMILVQPGGGEAEDVCIVSRWTSDEDVAGLSGDCFNCGS